MKPGRSNVGFAASKREVEERLYQIRLAAQEGSELASHGCGHFDGGSWSAAAWNQEFGEFRRILRDAYDINGIDHEPGGWRTIAAGVTGFRAPYLSAGPTLFQTLRDEGYAYDASGISPGPSAPYASGPVERFALPQIAEGPKGRRVIAMDYNMYVRHSRGKEDPTRSDEFQGRTYEAFKAAFDRQYLGDRVPLQLGFHFTLMNGAAYWRALERFAAEVCVKADTVCISYRDYLARQGKLARQAGG